MTPTMLTACACRIRLSQRGAAVGSYIFCRPNLLHRYPAAGLPFGVRPVHEIEAGTIVSRRVGDFMMHETRMVIMMMFIESASRQHPP